MTTNYTFTANGRRLALVVGIDDYSGAAYDLPSCRNDAREIAGLLRSVFGFDVRELHDGDATPASIMNTFRALSCGLAPADRLVFFFSGHGTRWQDGAVVRESLVTANLTRLDDAALVAESIALPAGTLTVVLDACFSGGMVKVVPGDGAISSASLRAGLVYRPFGRAAVAREHVRTGAALQKGGEPSLNALLMSACLEHQTAAASTAQTLGRSAFTHALLLAFNALGYDATASALILRTAQELARLQIAQTPLLWSPEGQSRLVEWPPFGEPWLARGAGSSPMGLADGRRLPGRST